MYTLRSRKKKKLISRWMGSIAVLAGMIKQSCRTSRLRSSDSLTHHQRSWTVKKISRAVMFVLLACGFGSAVAGGSYVFLSRSDIFKITEFIVAGNTQVPQQQILARAELKRGLNLLALDIDQVEKKTLSHPWIEKVSVKRHWPSTVEIRVNEYRPLALINIEREGRKQLSYVNKKGVVFAPSTPSRDLDYPVLTGDSLAEDIQDSSVISDSLLAKAVEFLNLAAKGNQILPAQAVSEVHVSSDRGVIVYLVDHPFPIYMGAEKIRTRFYLLVRVLAELYRQDRVKDIAEIRMDYGKDRILVANIGT